MTDDPRAPRPERPAPDSGAPDEALEEAAVDPGAAFGSETSEAEALRAPADGADFHDRWLRAEADLQNFRRRAAREREEARRDAEDRVLLDVVELLDDLERALAAMGEARADDPLAQGVALTARRMRDVLARHGVTPIAAVGQGFDPTVHEALLQVDAPEGAAPGSVVQEVLTGWQRGGRALRAARVVVAREHSED